MAAVPQAVQPAGVSLPVAAGFTAFPSGRRLALPARTPVDDAVERAIASCTCHPRCPQPSAAGAPGGLAATVVAGAVAALATSRALQRRRRGDGGLVARRARAFRGFRGRRLAKVVPPSQLARSIEQVKPAEDELEEESEPSRDASDGETAPREVGLPRRRLGMSELEVSKVCLGTMTFGKQNSQEEAHQMLDYAVKERGVNFMDTAEMYPVPTDAESHGLTDRCIGSWLKTSDVPRGDIVLASKVCGYATHLPWVRDAGGVTRVTRAQVRESVTKSLARLGTDYIDLLQIHWPDRYVALFGDSYDEAKQRSDDIPFEEQLEAFAELRRDGLVRHFGVSNETSYGVMNFIRAAEEKGLPRIVSIQNNYSLLVRSGFETDLAEVCSPKHANVSLLAYSPLAGGVLTGKYLNGARPSDARLEVFPGFMQRYRSSDAAAAAEEYAALARRNGLTPTQLALAWCGQRSFVTSTIVGATSVARLAENLDAFKLELSTEVLRAVDHIYARYRDPTTTPASFSYKDQQASKAEAPEPKLGEKSTQDKKGKKDKKEKEKRP